MVICSHTYLQTILCIYILHSYKCTGLCPFPLAYIDAYMLAFELCPRLNSNSVIVLLVLQKAGVNTLVLSIIPMQKVNMHKSEDMYLMTIHAYCKGSGKLYKYKILAFGSWITLDFCSALL